MGRPVRPSRADMMRSLNLAHRDLGAMWGKTPMMQVDVPEKRKQRPMGSNPDAPPLEREVLKAVWHYLARHPKVQWVTRLNSGTAMADFGASGTHPLRFNYKRGISDLIGQMKDGRFLAVECKREGVSLQSHQREFLNEVRAAHGVAFVARSIDDCVKEMGG